MEKYISDSLQSTDHNTEVLDIVGIGFGPSNIAIAIALQENAADLSAIFLERRPSFSWHETMLFDTAMMQVNFLKDLASFRNPRSHFTFVNFLHYQKRLADFTNLQTLFPRRTEFRQYLSWCAHHFDDIVRYSTSATSIETVLHDGVELFRIIAEGPDGSESILARNVVYSGGIEPRIPFPVVGEGRVSHGYNILKEIDNHTPGSHYAVVGAGQSAAEITEFIYQRGARVTAIISRFGYMPADDSPFVNQIFNPDQVDVLFESPDDVRAKIFEMHASTNYSGVDLDLLKSLYADWYHDKISGSQRFVVRRMTRVTCAEHIDRRVRLRLEGSLKNAGDALDVDYLICATGFEPRSVLSLFSEDLRARVRFDASGTPVFDRTYALEMQMDGALSVYAPHMSERQHGLTATLLSNMAIRSGEIVDSIRSRRLHPIVTMAEREIANAD
ncbi:MAG: lysine N(6)-hydroxylase/L-ornithine N(5)-oxygenase family protein [Rhodocyclaceae bacterium]|jgi:L-ornithine N5-oxygenase